MFWTAVSFPFAGKEIAVLPFCSPRAVSSVHIAPAVVTCANGDHLQADMTVGTKSPTWRLGAAATGQRGAGGGGGSAGPVLPFEQGPTRNA